VDGDGIGDGDERLFVSDAEQEAITASSSQQQKQ
jgi:hypothetical protein